MDANLENYKLLVEIFKGYLDTALSVHTTYYALTGAIAAYYLANRKDQSYVKYSLLLPLIFGCALIYVSFSGMSQALTLQGKVNEIVAKLAMPGAPPVDILRQGLFIMGVLDVIICAGLLLLFLSPAFIFGEKSTLSAKRETPSLSPLMSSGDENATSLNSESERDTKLLEGKEVARVVDSREGELVELKDKTRLSDDRRADGVELASTGDSEK